MNNLNGPCLAIGLLLGFRLAALADNQVHFPTGNFEYSVDLAQKHDGGSQPPGKPQRNLQRIEVTQLNKVRRLRFIWSTGDTTEQWTLPGLPVVFTQGHANEDVAAIPAGSGSLQSEKNSEPYDASAFDWLSPQTLQEKDPISYQGKQCFHYVGSRSAPVMSAPGQENLKPISSKYEAWIDSTTHQPVALDTGSAIATFTFDPKPPDGPLVPPEKFKKEIDYYKAVLGYP